MNKITETEQPIVNASDSAADIANAEAQAVHDVYFSENNSYDDFFAKKELKMTIGEGDRKIDITNRSKSFDEREKCLSPEVGIERMRLMRWKYQE